MIDEHAAGDPPYVPWPGPPDANWAMRRQILEGYMRTARRFETYRASRKHALVLRRFAFLGRQYREIWSEQTIRLREAAMIAVLRGMLEPPEIPAGQEDLAPADRLDVVLDLFRAGRGRQKRGSLVPARKMLQSSVVSPMLLACLRRVREEAQLRARKDRRHEWAWSLAVELLRQQDGIWARLAMVPTPFDYGLNWLERHATGAILLEKTDPLRPPPLALDHLDELRADLVRLEKHEGLVVAERSQLRERLQMGRMFAFDPMTSAPSDDPQCDVAVVFPTILCVLRRIDMDRILLEDVASEVKPEAEAIGEFARMCRDLPEFWWFAVRGLLWRTGGLGPDGRLAPWVEKLLLELLEHPGHFARWAAPPEAVKARSVFARLVAPLAHMTCPEHRGPLLINREGAKDPVFFLGCVSWILAQRGGLDQRGHLPLTRQGEHAMMALIGELQERAHALLAAMAACSEGPPYAPLEMYDEQAYLAGLAARGAAAAGPAEAGAERAEAERAEAERAEAAAEAAQPEPAAIPWSFTPPELPAGAPRLLWRYVWNPLEEHGRSEAVGAIRGRDAAGAEDFFRDHRIPTVVKPRSVLRALRYFEAMPEDIRRMLPSESAGGHRWAKLKRGGLRILLRVAGPESGEFHLLPRSRWTRPLEFL